jgi:hypothetical protein
MLSLTRCFHHSDVLRSSTANLLAPNLQLIAKGEEGSDEEICRLAGLILALVVQVRSDRALYKPPC